MDVDNEETSNSGGGDHHNEDGVDHYNYKNDHKGYIAKDSSSPRLSDVESEKSEEIHEIGEKEEDID